MSRFDLTIFPPYYLIRASTRDWYKDQNSSLAQPVMKNMHMTNSKAKSLVTGPTHAHITQTL